MIPVFGHHHVVEPLTLDASSFGGKTNNSRNKWKTGPRLRIGVSHIIHLLDLVCVETEPRPLFHRQLRWFVSSTTCWSSAHQLLLSLIYHKYSGSLMT